MKVYKYIEKEARFYITDVTKQAEVSGMQVYYYINEEGKSDVVGFPKGAQYIISSAGGMQVISLSKEGVMSYYTDTIEKLSRDSLTMQAHLRNIIFSRT